MMFNWSVAMGAKERFGKDFKKLILVYSMAFKSKQWAMKAIRRRLSYPLAYKFKTLLGNNDMNQAMSCPVYSRFW